MSLERKPAVAGQFYTDDPRRLRAEVERYLATDATPAPAIGLIAPHAGYVYSGAVAGEVYGTVTIPRLVVILGPNHHGIGPQAALYATGAWQSPLGTVPIDERLAGLLASHSPDIIPDESAHRFEHSLEVQVPFLQALRPDLAIVPLCLGYGDSHFCARIGAGLAAAIEAAGEPVLMVASSDMTHYESAESAREKDELAIAQILALNPAGLLSVCSLRRITMCGVIPATVMLEAALALGAREARLVRYATSGDVTGDQRQVVGYAGLVVR